MSCPLRGSLPGVSASRDIKFVYNLPYATRKDLCRLLDKNDDWKDLGGRYMKFSTLELNEFERACYRGESPAEAMLHAWGNRNHSILELFILLHHFRHFRGMEILADYVDPKYHSYFRLASASEAAAETTVKVERKSDIMEEQVDIGNVIPTTVKECVESKLLGTTLNFATREQKSSEGVFGGDILVVPYDMFTKTTAGWSTKLGTGGFGTAYKGLWNKLEVVVKRMDGGLHGRSAAKSIQNHLMSHFMNSDHKLKILSQRNHPNILRVHSCSMDGPFLCLMYQYMAAGTLQDKLSREINKDSPLSWTMRYEIAKGVASGLEFLHSILPKPMIHGELKSSNVFLDQDLKPKIGAFRVAREMEMFTTNGGPNAAQPYVTLPPSHSMTVSKAYHPHEYCRSKQLTPQVDIFSFGIILFEIATGQSAYSFNRRKHHILELLEDDSSISNHTDVRPGPENSELFAKFVDLGKKCTVECARKRPTIDVVVKILGEFLQQKYNCKSNIVIQNSFDVLVDTTFSSAMAAASSRPPPLSQHYYASTFKPQREGEIHSQAGANQIWCQQAPTYLTHICVNHFHNSCTSQLTQPSGTEFNRIQPELLQSKVDNIRSRTTHTSSAYQEHPNSASHVSASETFSSIYDRDMVATGDNDEPVSASSKFAIKPDTSDESESGYVLGSKYAASYKAPPKPNSKGASNTHPGKN